VNFIPEHQLSSSDKHFYFTHFTPSFKNSTFLHNPVLKNNETKIVSIHWWQHVPGCHDVGAQDSSSAFLGSVTGLFTPDASKECSAVIFKVLSGHR
jgi:hypothetical protein